MTVAGLLLAAGQGRRFGQPKALVRDATGAPWVARRLDDLAAGGCVPVLVVVGAAAEQVLGLLPDGVHPVLNARWDDDMGGSLRLGLQAAADLRPRPDAVLVALVDTPGLTPEAVSRLVRLAGPAALARAGYAGVPGHPVLIGRDHWDGVRQLAHGDAGARDYLHGRAIEVVECGDVADGTDVDVPET
jgi:CTP:molybdopterin cytidylyltransferase MocA